MKAQDTTMAMGCALLCVGFGYFFAHGLLYAHEAPTNPMALWVLITGLATVAHCLTELWSYDFRQAL